MKRWLVFFVAMVALVGCAISPEPRQLSVTELHRAMMRAADFGTGVREKPVAFADGSPWTAVAWRCLRALGDFDRAGLPHRAIETYWNRHLHLFPAFAEELISYQHAGEAHLAVQQLRSVMEPCGHDQGYTTAGTEDLYEADIKTESTRSFGAVDEQVNVAVAVFWHDLWTPRILGRSGIRVAVVRVGNDVIVLTQYGRQDMSDALTALVPKALDRLARTSADS